MASHVGIIRAPPSQIRQLSGFQSIGQLMRIFFVCERLASNMLAHLNSYIIQLGPVRGVCAC